uniref:Uncharacterized protein n=1 Tax=Anguilla anguilla TaxID=7936 RepID=A0A0E9PTF7_ANGAN
MFRPAQPIRSRIRIYHRTDSQNELYPSYLVSWAARWCSG